MTYFVYLYLIINNYQLSKREQTEQSESFESKSKVETFRNYQKWLFDSRVKKDQNWQIENKYIQQFKVSNNNKLLAKNKKMRTQSICKK